MQWPIHSGVYKSARHFRQLKRKEVKTTLKVMNDLMLGCAFTPAYTDLKAAQKHLQRAKELMSVARWKR